MQEIDVVWRFVSMRRDKLLDRMRANPRNDWRMRDVETIARRYDLSINRPKGGSSHVTLRHNSGDKLTIPTRRPIKPIYIRKLVTMIDQLEENHE